MTPEFLREELANLAHERWSHWMRYMFQQGRRNPDGTWMMPADKAARWTRQMVTPYADLPESEKDSDRIEAEKIFEIIRPYLPLGFGDGNT